MDVRVISATNRKLREESDAGRFRQDLYYRLSVFPIEIPPLRNRIEDIPLLAEQFLERLARKLGHRRLRLTLANVQQLQHYNWPGNVRELQHVLERATIGASDGKLRIELAKDSPRRPGNHPQTPRPNASLPKARCANSKPRTSASLYKPQREKSTGPMELQLSWASSPRRSHHGSRRWGFVWIRSDSWSVQCFQIHVV